MRVTCLLPLLLAAGLTALAQTNTNVVPAAPADAAPAPQPLSLADCFAIALEHNLDVQIARYEPAIARYNLAAAYGIYDPGLTLDGAHSYRRSPGGVDEEGRVFTGVESDTDALSGGLEGVLPWGLGYSLGASFSDQTGTKPALEDDLTQPTLVTNTFIDINTGNPISFVTTNFASRMVRTPFENSEGTVGLLTLRQPLLRNFWTDDRRITIYINKQELKISEANFRDQVMSTITAVETAYFNLVFAEENVKVQQMALELAGRLLAENRKRVEVGALAPLDEKQAESQAATSRADLLNAMAERGTQQRVLKALLSDDYTNKWHDVVVVPTEPLVAIPREFDLQESWRKGLALGPRFTLQQGRLALAESAARVRLARNQLFPQLDVIGSYGYNGSSKEYSGAWDQISRGENPFWSVGAQMSIPLANTAARNNLKAAKATRERDLLRLKQAEQNTLIQIENDIGVARTFFERVDATRRARQYAEAALDAEQKKLENGKSTSFVVLQLQKDLTDARSAEIRALADYNIALAELAFDEGTTLERRRIDLELE